jgi:hypothetical protein
MQPSEPLSADIKTLADWIYEQFRATDPIEVKNILATDYKFKYCVGENVETPDAVSRRVLERQYEEKTIPAGATEILMGAAAYIFVDGIARQYLYAKVLEDSKAAGMEYAKAEEAAANATADVQQLVEAAKLAIVGKVGYAAHNAPTSAPVLPNNPNAVKDDSGLQPQQTTAPAANTMTNTTSQPSAPTGDEDDDAFGDLDEDERFSVVPATESQDGKAHFFVDGKEVTNAEYNEARNAAKQPAA